MPSIAANGADIHCELRGDGPAHTPQFDHPEELVATIRPFLRDPGG